MQTPPVGAVPNDICLVRLSAIGDTCHALAVVRNLKDNWQDSNVTWIIGKTEASLMRDVSGVEFIIFDKRQGRRAYADVRRQLAGRQFDVALCMHASMRANFLVRSLPAKRKIGFDKARAKDYQWFFTNERIEAAPHEHALDAMMGFARHIGAEPTAVRWDIPIPATAIEFADRVCDANTVAISPVSSQRFRNYRNWPIERYKDICSHVVETRGCKVVITGGSSELEAEYADSLSRLPGVESIAGKSNLKELVAVFAKSRLVICPDSGPAHMATAVGTPVVGLYATSNPERTGPYLNRELTVNRYPEAVERYLGKSVDEVRWGQRVRHPGAMDLIVVDDVVTNIDLAMKEPL